MSYKRSNHCMITISFRPTKPFYILPATTSEHFQHVQISLIVPHFTGGCPGEWLSFTYDGLYVKMCILVPWETA